MEKLNKFAKSVTSQYGEDGIIEYILKHISDIPKVCVEFGAWDGKFLSNIFELWHNQGWKGILIEGDKERCGQILSSYSDFDIRVFNQWVTPEGSGSIDELFKKNNIDPNIGVLSIDIDSYDYYVWKNLNYVKPAILIIEQNQTIPAYIEYHDPAGEVFLRCSAKALETLGKEKGYKLVCCNHTNSLFIRNELFNPKFFPDKPVEYLFDYSHCLPVRLSAGRGPFTNLIPIYYGIPSKSQRIFSKIKSKIAAIVKKKNYIKPSASVIAQCKKSGIII